jgi:acetyltransferase-like isoleucine patch superfamily enzyme
MRADARILLTVARWYRGGRRRLRNYYLSRVLGSMGEGCQISEHVLITRPWQTTLGRRAIVNDFCILQCCEAATISIGDAVTISYGAQLLTGGLQTAEGLDHDTHLASSIMVESRVWIGANALVLPGVTLGRGSVVAAGAVVTNDVAAGHIVAGVPARVVGTLG